MTPQFDEERYLNVLARWRMLAQRRLAELTQEYESGLWERYFEEREILTLLREAKASVDIWTKISPAMEDAIAREPAVQAGLPVSPFSRSVMQPAAAA